MSGDYTGGERRRHPAANARALQLGLSWRRYSLHREQPPAPSPSPSPAPYPALFILGRRSLPSAFFSPPTAMPLHRRRWRLHGKIIKVARHCEQPMRTTRKPFSSSRHTHRTPPPRAGIARALSKLGLGSRSVAAEWVRAGRVSLNGKIVLDPETPVVIERDLLRLDGLPVQAREKRYLMLNKPRGLVTTRADEQGRATVYRCLGERDGEWLAPVGRLDKASEGLLLFTNDSVRARRLLDPAADGMALRAEDEQVLRRADKTCWLAITLCEGKNRHIRRLCEAFGLAVLRLVRIAIGPLALGTLAKGGSRERSAAELAARADLINAKPRK